MDIGGSDLVVACPLSKRESAILVSKLAKQMWPDVVFEGIESEHPDVFIYENAESKRRWDEDVPEEANMVYALFRDHEVTLVYDKGTGSDKLARYVAVYLMKLDILAKNPGCPTCCMRVENTNGADAKTG